MTAYTLSTDELAALQSYAAEHGRRSGKQTSP